MPFRVTARTILQLGAELISSDPIAFYELIKNGFDAGSKRVEVKFVIRLAAREWSDTASLIATASNVGSTLSQRQVNHLRAEITSRIDKTAPQSDDLIEKIATATTLNELAEGFERANSIIISDSGSGMSSETLEEVYLTIGTRFRRVERELAGAVGEHRLTVGDKGVGRLSVMRLGSKLRVLTTRAGDSRWHELYVDWNWFSHDSDQLIEAVPVQPSEGDIKSDPNRSGTELHVWGLRTAWTREVVAHLAREEFARFLDPFAEEQPVAIDITYNGAVIAVPRFDRLLFDSAHATMTADLIVSGPNSPRIKGDIDYRLGETKKAIGIDPLDTASVADTSTEQLRKLGPFRLELYWWNRGLLREIEGIGDVRVIRSLLNRWGGGVMVYRDGFRVNPYGGADDDWLDLDRDAFRAPSFKLNRQQIIAKLSISARENPALIDQTNREGLQHNAEFAMLRRLIKHLLEEKLRTFLDDVNERRRMQQLVPLEELERRSNAAERQVRLAADQLRSTVPDEVEKAGLIQAIDTLVNEISLAFKETKKRLEGNDRDRERLVMLAGTGLLIEIIAHELHRATTHALMTVGDASRDPRLSSARSVFDALGAQLKTLRTRLSVLDDVSLSSRQVKSDFDLVAWVRDIVENHQPQFKRHGILGEFSVGPDGAKQVLRVHMVRGMVVQVLENLLSNSVYWLKVAKRESPDFVGRIWVTVDTQAGRLTVTDNGPGIDLARVEEVFLPFATTKPPGEGSGLGLYIAREIARYHGSTLKLSPEPPLHDRRYNTFVLSLGKAVR